MTVRILDRETKALFLCRKNLTDIYIYINIVHIQITGRLTELGQKSPLEYKEGTQNFIQDRVRYLMHCYSVANIMSRFLIRAFN